MTNFEKLVLLEKLLTELEVNPEDLYAFAKAAEVLDRGWESEDCTGKFLADALPSELEELGLTPGLAVKVLTYL